MSDEQTQPRAMVGKAQKPRQRVDLGEYGTTGLRHYGGFVAEEWLRQLAGRKAAAAWREMSDNDPVVGAFLFAIKMLARSVEWTVEERKDPQAAELIEQCMSDMSHTWDDFVSEALSMLPFGWALHEIVYKRRQGPDSDPASDYNDGKIGWRKLPVRAQETLWKWEFADDGGIEAMDQLAYDGVHRTIPITKALLFRTETTRGNPEGRALALDTPIPTPDGMRTMADLEVGSRVFDEQGRIRYVTAVADWQDRPCYRVTFTDGTSIVADANHQWATRTTRERSAKAAASLRTTAEIAATVKASQGASNHGIAWASALDYTEQHVAVDPYVLGLWLGDGSTRCAQIACHADDAEETVRLIEAAGYRARIIANGGSANGRQIVVAGSEPRRDTVQGALRWLGVIDDKHVPPQYLRGSREQRLALLQGLMDSDGTVDRDGRCEFVNTNTRLIDACAELVRSLGVGCRVSLRARANGGTRKQDAYCVKFTPPFAPFRLARKAARAGKTHARPFHYIATVETVEPRPTRCIEVDGPSHLFLAGDAMVPTHNSVLRNAYVPWFRKKNIEEVEAIGIARDLAGIPTLTPPEGVDLSQPQYAELFDAAKDLVTTIARDEDEGVVLPQHGWELQLLASAGSRQIDTDAVVRRYDQRIATTVLADFILLAQDRVGSYGLASVKVDTFGEAMSAWLGSIAEVLNRYAVPRLLRLNGMAVLPATDRATLKPGDPGKADMAQLGEFLQALSLAGAPDFWSEDLLKALFELAGLPAPEVTPAPAAVEKADRIDPRDLGVVLSERRAPLLEKAFDRDVAAALGKIGDQLADVYLASVGKAAGDVAGDDGVIGKLLSAVGIETALRDHVRPVYLRHYQRVLRDTLQTIKAEIGLHTDLPDEAARRILQAGGSRVGLLDVEKQARDAIMRALADGRANGDGPVEIARRIREYVPAGRFTKAGTGYRSKLIARTETLNAQRASALEAYRAAENVTAVILRDGLTANSDAECAARDGDVVSFDEADALMQDEHPNGTLSFSPLVGGA